MKMLREIDVSLVISRLILYGSLAFKISGEVFYDLFNRGISPKRKKNSEIQEARSFPVPLYLGMLFRSPACLVPIVTSVT